MRNLYSMPFGCLWKTASRERFWYEGFSSETKVGTNPTEGLTKETRAAPPDKDAGPAKVWRVKHRHDPQWRPYFERAYGKRPREELYNLARDPHPMHNVAGQPAYAHTRARLEARLLDELRRRDDPRLKKDGPSSKIPRSPVRPRIFADGRPPCLRRGPATH